MYDTSDVISVQIIAAEDYYVTAIEVATRLVLEAFNSLPYNR